MILRRKDKIKYLSIFIMLLIISNIMTKYYYENIIIKDINKREELSKKEVYILKEDIKRGEKITKDKLNKIKIDSNLTNDKIMNYKNKFAKIDLKKGLVLTNSIITKTDINSKLRYQEIYNIKIPNKLKKGDFIDIRYKNREVDGVIVSFKKVIEKFQNGLGLYLKADEIKKISKLENTNSQIYVNIYIKKQE